MDKLFTYTHIYYITIDTMIRAPGCRYTIQAVQCPRKDNDGNEKSEVIKRICTHCKKEKEFVDR